MTTTPINTAQAKSFTEAPRWAHLMRDLFDRMPAAVETVCKRYLREDGSVLWPPSKMINKGLVDGLDDAYESFHAWPLAYMLGADKSLLERAENGFEAVTKQFASIQTGHGHPMVVNEYEQGYDWFHQGEGYMLFYYLCAAKPDSSINRDRAGRYAGFLRNIDVPEPNFNFETFHFLCPHVGSMGAAFRNFNGRSGVYRGLLQYYGLPFQNPDITKDPAAYLKDDANNERYALDCSKRLGRGDVAINLASTTMAVNAFLTNGDTDARDWALQYIDNWIEKAEKNGGLIPDNVGLSGEVGEYMDGDWFGGNYGWVWPHGWSAIARSVSIAAQNGFLLTGDPKYPAFLRRQMQILAEKGVEREGALHIPNKYGKPGWYDYDTSIPMLSQVLRTDEGPILWKDGWFEFMPMQGQYPTWLWEMTMTAEDEELMVRLRNHRRPNWRSVDSVPAKDLGGHAPAWAAYVRGEFPDYPERILEHNHLQMDEQLAFIEADQQDPETHSDSYLQRRNPITCEGLLQLTTGGSMPVYNGGLILSRLRYFDPQEKRCGLPRDVAALVERMDDTSVDLCLVNLNSSTEKTVVLRAGFHGEHRFVEALPLDADASQTPQLLPAGNRQDLSCALPPHSSFRVRLKMGRFVNPPRSAFPDWDTYITAS